MQLASRLNAQVSGPLDASPLVFLHGFGCGQAMWRHLVAAFDSDYRVVLLDLPGSGDADPTVYDAERYTSLEAYADDVLLVLRELELTDVTLVGHSVSSMIAVLAHNAAPDVVTRLVLVTPSARYLDEGDYCRRFRCRRHRRPAGADGPQPPRVADAAVGHGGRHRARRHPGRARGELLPH